MNGQNAEDNTINYYNDNAQAFIEQTFSLEMKTLYEPFIASLPATTQNQQYILDVGCGSGRDSLYFAQLGLDVTAVDSSSALIDLAKNAAQQGMEYQGTIDWHCATFQDILEKDWRHQFTAIWACASLLHVPYEALPALINGLLSLLTDDGGFYASFKYGDTERLNDNRFFCDINEARWQIITQKFSHKFKGDTWLTNDQRAHRDEKWFNIMIKLQG